MLKATVEGGGEYSIVLEKDAKSGTVNGAPFNWDVAVLGDGHFHILFRDRSFQAEIISADKEKKEVVVRVNHTEYTVALKDRYDALLKTLGMENTGAKRVRDIKAPMPGMVLNVLVTDGQEVEKDSPLLILEAMKMENVIKSPAPGVVKRIAVNKGVAVEKNTVLIEFA